MSRPLLIEPTAGDAGYKVWTAARTFAGDLILDRDKRWLFYAVGTNRPAVFHAADARTAFAFLENLSRVFSAA